jgi:hypothetical protein
MLPTDLIFDDGELMESNRPRIAINVLIRSINQAFPNRDNFLVAGKAIRFMVDYLGGDDRSRNGGMVAVL